MASVGRKRILACYIEVILKYDCESWTISKQTNPLRHRRCDFTEDCRRDSENA